MQEPNTPDSTEGLSRADFALEYDQASNAPDVGSATVLPPHTASAEDDSPPDSCGGQGELFSADSGSEAVTKPPRGLKKDQRIPPLPPAEASPINPVAADHNEAELAKLHFTPAPFTGGAEFPPAPWETAANALEVLGAAMDGTAGEIQGEEAALPESPDQPGSRSLQEQDESGHSCRAEPPSPDPAPFAAAPPETVLPGPVFDSAPVESSLSTPHAAEFPAAANVHSKSEAGMNEDMTPVTGAPVKLRLAGSESPQASPATAPASPAEPTQADLEALSVARMHEATLNETASQPVPPQGQSAPPPAQEKRALLSVVRTSQHLVQPVAAPVSSVPEPDAKASGEGGDSRSTLIQLLGMAALLVLILGLVGGAAFYLFSTAFGGSEETAAPRIAASAPANSGEIVAGTKSPSTTAVPREAAQPNAGFARLDPGPSSAERPETDERSRVYAQPAQAVGRTEGNLASRARAALAEQERRNETLDEVFAAGEADSAGPANSIDDSGNVPAARTEIPEGAPTRPLENRETVASVSQRESVSTEPPYDLEYVRSVRETVNSLSISGVIGAGRNSRMLMDDQVYNSGDIVDIAKSIYFLGVNPKTRTAYFRDADGLRYDCRY